MLAPAAHAFVAYHDPHACHIAWNRNRNDREALIATRRDVGCQTCLASFPVPRRRDRDASGQAHYDKVPGSFYDDRGAL